MLYRIDIKTSHDGRSNRDNYTNTFFMKSAALITAPELRTQATQLVEAMRPYFLTFVHLMRAKVTQVADNAGNKVETRFQSWALGGTGQRVVVGDRLFRDYALIVDRAGTEMRAGRLEIRGMLLGSDVQVQPDGSVALDASGWAMFDNGMAGTLATDIKEAITSGEHWLMPKRLGVNDDGRPVEWFYVNSVRLVQTTRKRSSILSAEADLAQRKLNEYNARLARLQKEKTESGSWGEYLELAIQVWLAAWAFYNGTNLPVRMLLTVPRLLALPQPSNA